MTNEEVVKKIKEKLVNENTAEYLEKLYINNKGYIYKIASKYIGYAELDDLVQEGFLGMYDAVKAYDDTKGNLFITYASYHIQKSIIKYIENNCKTIRIPGHLLSQIQEYKKAVNILKVESGRRPTKLELSNTLKIDFEQLKDLENTFNKFNKMKSLNEPIKGIDDDSMFLEDSISDNGNLENDLIDSMMQRNLKSELWKIVKENTTEEENKVIKARYIYDLSLEKTGQTIGQSRDRIRGIEAKALRKLRRYKVFKEIMDKFEINYASVYRSSFNSFNYDWTSSTERVALRNIELESNIDIL